MLTPALVFCTSIGVWGNTQPQRTNLQFIDPELALLADLNSTSTTLNNQAFTELRRLYVHQRSLSKTARDRFIAICLGRQMDNLPDKVALRMRELLLDQFVNHELTPKEVERFIRQTVSAQVMARPQMIASNHVPVVFRIQLCAPHSGMSHRVCVRIRECRDYLDGEFLRNTGTAGTIASRWGGARNIPLPYLAPGKHRVGGDAVVEVYFGLEFKQEEGRLLFKTTIRDEADFIVLEGEPPNYITERTDPALQASMRESIRPNNFKFVSHRFKEGLRIEGSLGCCNPPAGFAFDMFARIGGREYYLNGKYCASPSDMGEKYPDIHPEGPVYTGPIIDEITLVLRPNKVLARQSLTLFEIWGGELVYEHVPVAAPPKLARVLEGTQTAR